MKFFSFLKPIFQGKLTKRGDSDSMTLSSLSENLKMEIHKIVSDPNYGQSLREFFNAMLGEEKLNEIMKTVKEKMRQANRDGKSHSVMVQDNVYPIMISISVWPDCDLGSLPSRFKSEVGVNYLDAADRYRNKAFSMSAKAFTHLFFCYNEHECGVAVAFFACDQRYLSEGTIIPESIYMDEMRHGRI